MKKFKLPVFLVVFTFLMIALNACEQRKNGNDNKNIDGADPKVLPIETKEDEKDSDFLEEEFTDDDIATDEESDEIIDIEITEVDALVTVEEPKGNYKVVLETDSIIHLDETATLRIWIGPEEAKYEGLPQTVKDTGSIAKRLGQYAKIFPKAADFEVIGDQGKCYKIDKDGSSVRFSLRPKNKGDFSVSADVEMHKKEDCSDAAVPQSGIQTLSVQVKVDKMQELSDIVWENFKKFWGALVALIFGAILFVVRRKIKKTTGYEAPEE